jgi:diguanylate cyclase (GGDEF)-like protein
MNKLAIIIENDQDSANLFSHVLEFVGFETEIFLSGRQALKYLGDKSPIIILLDLHLSHEVSGENILKYIRNDPRLSKTYVIVITGYPNLVKAVEDLADFILLKPVSMPQLSALVSRVCNDQISDVFFRHASHNALTGLPNRALLKDRLEHSIARSNREKDSLFSLLILQITNLEPIRLIGNPLSENHILNLFVERLKHQLREVDTLACIGNDLFAILLDNIANPNDASIVVERLRTELALPYMIDQQETFLSVDIHIVPSIQSYGDAEKILEIAEQCIEGETF